MQWRRDRRSWAGSRITPGDNDVTARTSSGRLFNTACMLAVMSDCMFHVLRRRPQRRGVTVMGSRILFRHVAVIVAGCFVCTGIDHVALVKTILTAIDFITIYAVFQYTYLNLRFDLSAI